MDLSPTQRASKRLAKDIVRDFVRRHDLVMLTLGNNEGALVASRRSHDTFQGDRNDVVIMLMPMVKRFLYTEMVLPLDISLLVAGALADELPKNYPSDVTGSQLLKHIAVLRIAGTTFDYLQRKYEEDQRLKAA